jgi:serine/threonine-protein kinase
MDKPPVKSKATNDSEFRPAPAATKDQLAATEPEDASKKPAQSLEETELESAPKPGKEKLAETAAGPTPASPARAEGQSQKTSTLGEFRLLKKLGAGGMGTVYKARQDALDRDVAIKVMFKHLAENERFIERFYREARLQAKLDHPHIVRCYSVGQDKGYHYLAMEFVDGGSVQGYLSKHKKFSIGDALHVILACSYALQHAHEQSMIHRDIKPDNLLITSKGVVKLADLGLAKALDEDLALTQSGMGAGTPYYMSPEQTRNAKHVDARSDIYSMGVMLYAMVAGEMPFRGETTVELLQAKEKGKFEPARKRNPDVPEKLDLIIDKMVAKNPDHRYQNCTDLIHDLESFGLANAAPSFIGGGVPSGVRAMPSAIPSQLAVKSGLASRHATTEEEEVHGPDPNWWHVKYTNKEGKQQSRKLTTAQVQDLIKSKVLDNRADASHDGKTGFRSLATYAEFEPLLRTKTMQARADRKLAKFHNVYEHILEEEQKYKKRRWWRHLTQTVGGWVTLLFFLAVLAGIGYLLYWLAATYGHLLLEKLGLR